MHILNLIPLFFQRLGAMEIIIIVVVFLLLFGAKKIPELMHGVGKGIRGFKKGLNDIGEEISRDQADAGKGETTQKKE